MRLGTAVMGIAFCAIISTYMCADVDPARLTSFQDHYRKYITSRQLAVKKHHRRIKKNADYTLLKWKAIWNEALNMSTYADLIALAKARVHVALPVGLRRRGGRRLVRLQAELSGTSTGTGQTASLWRRRPSLVTGGADRK